MKISELTPYKSNLIYKKAKKEFPPVGSRDELGTEWNYGRNNALITFSKYLKKKGFKELGQGSFGATFTHPQYPWVFKLFYNDPSYFKFFEFVRANQGNPYLPKIKGKYIKIAKGVYVVRLEKLDYINRDNPKHKMFKDAVEDIYSPATIKNRAIRLKKVDPLLYDTLMKINKIRGKGDQLDLHFGNFLFRGDTGVIIDPIYNPSLH
jgi:hypothetical protein